MFCILITAFIGAQVISREMTAHCYPTAAACERDAPRVAHALIPVEGRMYGFRCVREERAI